jgi:hypothetical protein
MKTGLLGVARTANREMEGLMEEVSQKGVKILESPGALGRLRRLVLRLKQVDHSLAEGRRSSAKIAEAKPEILKYEENLKALKTALETLQLSLLVS